MNDKRPLQNNRLSRDTKEAKTKEKEERESIIEPSLILCSIPNRWGLDGKKTGLANHYGYILTKLTTSLKMAYAVKEVL